MPCVDDNLRRELELLELNEHFDECVNKLGMTLCDYCSKVCDRSVPLSGSCSSYENRQYKDILSSYVCREYHNMPRYFPIEQRKILSPKEYGMMLNKRGRRR